VGGSSQDFALRLYDVTAAAQVQFSYFRFSTFGSGNYARAVDEICFCLTANHEYVYQVSCSSSNDDFIPEMGKLTMKYLGIDGCP
jgi:hypothetical protein